MRGGFVEGPVRVRVPATSANVGPGFDALGLALGWYDDVTAKVCGTGLAVEVEGEGSAAVHRDETHLVVLAMRRTFEALSAQPTGLAVRCVNRIPHGRGLGSSAAAIVAGVLLARALTDDGVVRLHDGDVLGLAAELEGHPDNVAACLLGGLTIAWHSGSAHAVRCEVDPAVQPVLLVPPYGASTEHGRGLLPETISHSDAAFCAGRAALIVGALTGAPHALLDATEDRLHQRYRAPALAESLQLVTRLRAAAHPAIVSGAGPAVLVLTRGVTEVKKVTAGIPHGWRSVVPRVDFSGATLLGPASAGGPCTAP